MTEQKYNLVSLFSGGMGLDLGLEATGRFHLLSCLEKEAAFCKTIRTNIEGGHLHPKLQVFEGDIAEIDPAAVLASSGLQPGEVDLLVGGPPCQSFSTAGRRQTVQDPRGTLLWQFMRYITYMRPKFFLMENVRGLLSAALRHRPIAQRPDKGGPPLEPDEEPGSVVRLFSKDLQQIPGCPYHLDIFEVNSVNYGAPQIRERVLFLGNRFNAQLEFPDPTHGASSSPEAPPSLFAAPRTLPWRTLRDAIADLQDPEPLVMDFSPRKKKYLEMVPPGSNWRSLPVDIQKESMGRAWYAKGGRSGWWRRLTFDLPCPTLVTMPNHASTSLCHPSQTRALSVREYARIQEFPDDWRFCGTLPQQYAQIGNAVPTRLGRVAGQLLAEELDKFAARDWVPHEGKPADYRIVYVQSHVRTRQWFRNGETFVWQDGLEVDNPTYTAPRTQRKVTKVR